MRQRTSLVCVVCGTAEDENKLHGHLAAGPHCHRCYGAGQKTEKAQRAAAGQRAGEAFWAARGIAIGAPVTVQGRSILYGAFPIRGVARVGASGAYVSSPSYPRHPLDPTGAVAQEG